MSVGQAYSEFQLIFVTCFSPQRQRWLTSCLFSLFYKGTTFFWCFILVLVFLILLFMMGQSFSIGDRFRLQAGQSSTSILSTKPVWEMRPGIVSGPRKIVILIARCLCYNLNICLHIHGTITHMQATHTNCTDVLHHDRCLLLHPSLVKF